MFKCSPIDARKNLEAANVMANNGIDFVAVPVISQADKDDLQEQVQTRFDQLVATAEAQAAQVFEAQKEIGLPTCN